MDDRTIEALASGEPVGTGGPLLDEHVICPACAHNFGAISQTSRDRIAVLEAELVRAEATIANAATILTNVGVTLRSAAAFAYRVVDPKK